MIFFQPFFLIRKRTFKTIDGTKHAQFRLPFQHKRLKVFTKKKTKENIEKYMKDNIDSLVNLPRGGHSSFSNGNRFPRLPVSITLCTVGFLFGFASSTSSNLFRRQM